MSEVSVQVGIGVVRPSGSGSADQISDARCRRAILEEDPKESRPWRARRVIGRVLRRMLG
jgi:hypothetical protein